MHQYSLPKFTCDVRTKFADINLFHEPPGMTSRRIDSGRYSFQVHMADVTLAHPTRTKGMRLKLLDVVVNQEHFELSGIDLDFLMPKELFPTGMGQFYRHICIQTWLGWRKAFLYFRPKSEHFIGLLEQCHRQKTQSILAQLDAPKFYQNVPKAVYAIAFQYYNILTMSWLSNVDLSAMEDLRSALESRLTFLSGVLSTRKPSTKTTVEDAMTSHAALVRSIEERAQSANLQYPVSPQSHKFPSGQLEKLLAVPKTKRYSE
jgi:hypothetical protein